MSLYCQYNKNTTYSLQSFVADDSMSLSHLRSPIVFCHYCENSEVESVGLDGVVFIESRREFVFHSINDSAKKIEDNVPNLQSGFQDGSLSYLPRICKRICKGRCLRADLLC